VKDNRDGYLRKRLAELTAHDIKPGQEYWIVEVKEGLFNWQPYPSGIYAHEEHAHIAARGLSSAGYPRRLRVRRQVARSSSGVAPVAPPPTPVANRPSLVASMCPKCRTQTPYVLGEGLEDKCPVCGSPDPVLWLREGDVDLGGKR
jgi:hypothetical protein